MFWSGNQCRALLPFVFVKFAVVQYFSAFGQDSCLTSAPVNRTEASADTFGIHLKGYYLRNFMLFGVSRMHACVHMTSMLSYCQLIPGWEYYPGILLSPTGGAWTPEAAGSEDIRQ